MMRAFYFVSKILFIHFLAGCAAPQNVAYLQEEPFRPTRSERCSSSRNTIYVQEDEASAVTGNRCSSSQVPAWPPRLYDARILPKDLLTVTVSATDPEAVKPFNLTVPGMSTGLTTHSQPQLQPYLVDNEGRINFPVVGMIEVSTLTKREAEEKIAGLLARYLKEPPVVTVSFVNYKISVLGEVARPNTFTISNEKVNVFEALAMAGDMTIWGRRDNVKIIREDARGNQKVILLNLNDRDVIHSPYFYLQQNDVVYVEPNKTKAMSSGIGSATNMWLSATSIVISVATLLVNVLK